MAIGTTLKIAFDGSAVQKGMGSISRGMTSIANVGKKAALAIAGIAAGITATAVAFTAAVLKINKIGEAANTSEARLRNVVEQMGLFGDQSGAVSQRLLDLASKQSMLLGIDKKTIQMTQSKLLTFRALAESAGDAGGVFDQVTMAALNLAANGMGTAETNAIKLGRAFSDVEQGLKVLGRDGTLTRQEMDAISEQFIKTGNEGEAFESILAAINRQAGNAAAATANASDRIAAMGGEMRDAFAGGFAGIMALTPDMGQGIAEGMIAPMKNAGRVSAMALVEGLHGNFDKIEQIGRLLGDIIVAGMQPILEQALPRILSAYAGMMQDFANFLGVGKLSFAGSAQKFFQGMHENPLERTRDILQQRNVAGQVAALLEQGNITEVPNLPGYRFAKEGEDSNLYAGDKKIVPILETIARNTSEGAKM